MADLLTNKPKTANEIILDSLVRHQTYLFRFAASQRNEAMKVLNETEETLRAIMFNYGDKFEDVPLISDKGRELTKQMTADIVRVRSTAWKTIIDKDLIDAKVLARLEQKAVTNVIENAVPVQLGLNPLPAPLLSKIALATPFEGRTLSEWLKRTGEVDVETIVKTAKNGIKNGDTPTQLARRVIGSRKLKRRDGVTRKAFNNLEAVYITVTNGIANEVKQAVYRENSDVIKKELFVATLDLRTTIICANNDGQTFKLGVGPVPPLHFRCRSLRVPYINPDNLLNRPFKLSTEKQLIKEFAAKRGITVKSNKYENLPRGTKTAYNLFARARMRELVGQVPATMSYSEWLGMQSVELQNEYLGIRRAEIFRQGKLSLDKFVTREGRELTIKELEKLI